MAKSAANQQRAASEEPKNVAAFEIEGSDNDVDIEEEEPKPITSMKTLLQSTGALKAPTVQDDPEPTKPEDMDNYKFVIPKPTERVVVLRKIPRTQFRLGLEKLPENIQLMPGAKHGWEPEFRGDVCLTGLEETPEKRQELEKRLGRDLSPTSDFWKELTFTLYDREHGMMVNLDDPTFGAYNEVVTTAMTKSSVIANGLHEFENGTKPAAEWYIENTEAELDYKLEQQDYHVKAMRYYDTAGEVRLRYAAIMLDIADARLSNKGVRVALYNFINKSPMNAERFCKTMDMKSDELMVEVLVRMGITHGVISRNQNKEYTYNNEVIGNDIKQVVKRLRQPSAAVMRQNITEDLEKK